MTILFMLLLVGYASLFYCAELDSKIYHMNEALGIMQEVGDDEGAKILGASLLKTKQYTSYLKKGTYAVIVLLLIASIVGLSMT